MKEETLTRLRRVDARLCALMRHEGMTATEIEAAVARTSKHPQPDEAILPRVEARLVRLMVFSGMQTDGRNPLKDREKEAT